MDAREVNVFLQCLARVASTGDAVRARGVVEEVLARVAAEDGFGAACVSFIHFFWGGVDTKTLSSVKSNARFFPIT
jgi:hypothetical protein